MTALPSCEEESRMKRTEPVVLHERDCELGSWSDETRDRVRWRTLPSGGRNVFAADSFDEVEYRFEKPRSTA